MKLFFVQFVLAILFLAHKNQAQKPNHYLSKKPAFLTPCPQKANNFQVCFAQNFQSTLKVWANGVPGLEHLGKTDPFFVKRVRFANTASPTLQLKAQLDNLLISGTSEVIIESANFDQKTYTTTLKVRAPKINIKSDYKAVGRVLGLTINSSGKNICQADNVVILLKVALTPRRAYGHIFTDVKEVKSELLNVGGFHIELSNLFNGQKELEDAANAIFNEQWRVLYEILRPVFEQTVAGVMKEQFRRIFSYVPANYYIQDIA